MNSFKAKLVEKIKRTPTIESFRFSIIDKLSFLPGQYIQVMFDSSNPDNTKINKYLSISCSPSKDYIEVTKRLSESDFSYRLRSLKEADELSFSGPFGNCVFRPEFEKIAFLIGGIGITPVISMLEYVAEKNLSTDSILLYSNRSTEEAAFKDVLDGFSGHSKNIKTIFTVSEESVQNQDYLYGRIDKTMVESYMPDFQQRIFFIFGPGAMVEAMVKILKDLKVQEANIKKEVFIGY